MVSLPELGANTERRALGASQLQTSDGHLAPSTPQIHPKGQAQGQGGGVWPLHVEVGLLLPRPAGPSRRAITTLPGGCQGLNRVKGALFFPYAFSQEEKYQRGSGKILCQGMRCIQRTTNSIAGRAGKAGSGAL